eukprot:COSAG03_NODE_33475_length_133_cov_787.852941_1_plen_27_part_01
MERERDLLGVHAAAVDLGHLADQHVFH